MKYNKNTDYLGVIPKTYEFEGVIYQNYDKFTELHEEHGWIDYVVPNFNSETQKLGKIIVVDNIATREIIDLTTEEIQSNEKAKVPFSVTNIQIRKALIQIGIFPSNITNILYNLPKDTIEDKIKREFLINLWEYANVMERNDNNIITFGLSLGLDDSALDNLFILASTL